MEFLQNAWVVGIGGGVISGLVVYALTALIFSKQSKRESDRRVAAANQEVVLAVRQGVPENRVPTESVLRALVAATARKHGLEPEYLYGPSEVAQDLIKDVMDSSFISAETKESFTNRLSELILPPVTDQPEKSPYAGASRGQVAIMSVGFSVMTALTTLMFTLLEERSGARTAAEDFRLGIWAPILTALVAVSVTVLLALYLNFKRRLEVRETEAEINRLTESIASRTVHFRRRHSAKSAE